MEHLYRQLEARLRDPLASDAPFLVPGRARSPGLASTVPGRAPIQAKRAIPGGKRKAPPRLTAGGGQPLPATVRRKMEAELGADFSAVRVHEGPEAASMGALAFARGDDVYFQPGRYDPSSPAGQELLGHELAHVVQQRQGRVPATAQAKGLAINADASLEREADEIGARAARNDGAPGTFDRAVRAFGAAPSTSGAGVVQRMRVDDLELSDDEIWDEVSWFLFDDRGLPSKLKDKARDYFDRIPEEAEYKYFEDIADEIEQDLRTRFRDAFKDWKPPKPSGDGGLLWKGMKLLVGYLAFSSLIPGVGGSPVPKMGGGGGGSSLPPTDDMCPIGGNTTLPLGGLGGGTCPIGGNTTLPLGGLGSGPLPDLTGGTCPIGGNTTLPLGGLGGSINGTSVPTTPPPTTTVGSSPPTFTPLTNVSCEPSVSEFCTTARTNPIYDGVIREVDSVCKNVTIEGPRPDDGLCRLSPTPLTNSGSISCKDRTDYDSSKIGHELEHGVDHCRIVNSGGNGLTGSTSVSVNSEIHAHTVQAAAAKLDMLQGKPVSQRDQELVSSFDAGCPEPTPSTNLNTTTAGMYSIVNIYHGLYVKTPIDRLNLISTYGTEIRRAVARYNEMISTSLYTSSRNYKHIK